MTNFLPVSIDLQQICEHLSQSQGRPVSEVEATVWLRSEGFVLFGNSWIGDEQSKRKLEEIHRQVAAQTAQ